MVESRKHRIRELDLLKAFGIICMVICHAVFRLGPHRVGYENDFLFLLGDVVLGEYAVVAHGFMFAMGVGLVFSKRSTPGRLLRRGLWILLLAYILNFLRYGIYALAYAMIEGEFLPDTVFALVSPDILQFAGIALLFTGFLKWLKLGERMIFAISVVLSLLGGPLAFVFQGGPLFNYLLGLLVITTREDACFAFLNWYVFVGFGMMFGRLLQRTSDEDGFYRRVLWTSGPVAVLYIVLSFIFGNCFLSKGSWYYAASLPEAIGLLSIDLVLMAGFHFMLKRVDQARLSIPFAMSRNITRIYVIHWCILGFVDSIFCYLLEMVFPYALIYLFGMALLAASCWISFRLERRSKQKK